MKNIAISPLCNLPRGPRELEKRQEERMVRSAQTAIYLEGETERQSGKKSERERESERERQKH